VFCTAFFLLTIFSLSKDINYMYIVGKNSKCIVVEDMVFCDDGVALKN
jgi:hypothetical protein